jgi:hypothetical protein
MVAVIVVDCPAARDAPPLEARAMAIGVLLLQLAVKRAAMRAKIQREDRELRTERGWDDMKGILFFLDPRGDFLREADWLSWTKLLI